MSTFGSRLRTQADIRSLEEVQTRRWVRGRSPDRVSIFAGSLCPVRKSNGVGLRPTRGLEARPTRSLTLGGFFFFQLVALLFQDRFAAELDFVAFKRQDLDQDLIAFLQLIANLFDAVF